MRHLRTIERLGWGAGLLLLAVWGGVRVHGELGRRAELARFEAARDRIERGAEAVPPSEHLAPGAPAPAPASASDPDTTLWSDVRIAAYEESLVLETGLPLGVLRVPSIDLEVAVLDGTDEITLNRAVGRIAGTAAVGETGNMGIAGHRDGFFRGLKDVAEGDVIELETLDGTDTYVIERMWIVEPGAVEVLEPTAESAITLVTCYPFYHVGAAPLRYIVRAVKPAPEGGAVAESAGGVSG
jgi:sortase A